MPSGRQIKPIFFATPLLFRRWLQKNHASVTELWVGFHKRDSGKPSITWPESVDQALCFGWIDGLRKSYNADSYIIRFTPRKPKSIWSAVNIRRAKELIKLGQMRAAGRKAFAGRDEERAKKYSFEQGRVELSPSFLRTFRSNNRAWEFFQSQPAGYRRTATWWVMSAKQDATKSKRLATLIADSEDRLRIGLLRRTK